MLHAYPSIVSLYLMFPIQRIVTATLLSVLFFTTDRALADVVFDYAVVGGGAAGLALAARLSEDPSMSVVVLEAGVNGFDNPNVTDLRLSRNNIGSLLDWKFVTIPQVDAGGRSQDQAQGKVLGGGSAINSGMYTRGNKIEYDALEALGATGWNWNTMFAASKKSEHFFVPTPADVQALNTTFNPAFHGFSGPIALSTQALNISGFFPQIVVPTLRSLGFNLNFDSNGGNHRGPSWNYLTTLPDTSTRSYAVSGYYLPIANRSNLRVFTESQVSRIIWSAEKTDEGLFKATGVEFLALNDSTDGIPRKMSLNASNVILSAGALNTPKLLELSGVGDANILTRVGIDVQIDLPGVGANLCNQPMSTASYTLKNGSVDVLDLIRPAILDFQPFSAFFNASDLARSRQLLSVKPPNIPTKQFDIMKTMIEETDVPQFEFAWDLTTDQNNVTSLIFDRLVLLKPLSRGFVHINSTNPLDPPVINPRYLSATHDKFALAKAVQYTRTLVNTEPLKAFVEGPLIPDQDVQTDEDFVNFVIEQSESEHHFVGTAAMVPRSEGGVVDPSLLVYGTSNVRVVDMSVISNIPSIHTVSLAYSVAERAAEIITASQ